MAPLKFCANISWLFTELPDFSQRILAAAAAGFRAVEAAWPYDSDLQELQRVREATGVEVVLLNTPPGRRYTGVTHLVHTAAARFNHRHAEKHHLCQWHLRHRSPTTVRFLPNKKTIKWLLNSNKFSFSSTRLPLIVPQTGRWSCDVLWMFVSQF